MIQKGAIALSAHKREQKAATGRYQKPPFVVKYSCEKNTFRPDYTGGQRDGSPPVPQ